MKLYHGTSQPDAILADGFDLDAERRTDPGDFGWGVYLTDHVSRAACHGTVLEVEVDTSRFAFIPSPYFLDGLTEREPVTDVEKLFHGIAFEGGVARLIKGSHEDRVAVAKRVRQVFLAAGYDGIRSAPDSRGQTEVVVFRVEVIQSVSRRSQDD